jgi:CubicO group peptidase (beta-lactamase class C family)
MKQLNFLAMALLVLLHPLLHAQPKSITKGEIDSLLRKAASQGFSGSVLVYQGNKLLAQSNHGTRVLNSGARITSDTRLNIGSIGKSLTAVLVMQLVEKNRIALDSPAAAYLAKQHHFPNAGKITVRQLLSHTSGLGDFFDHPSYASAKPKTIDAHLQLVKTQKPVSDTPGKRLIYSNSGFIVLGKILETIHQKPYHQVVLQNILLPAGTQPARKDVAYATGYYQSGGKWIRGEGNEWTNWSSAGGLFLSVNELHSIIKALVQGKYLDEISRKQLWAKVSHPEQDPPFVWYGLGWMVETPVNLTFLGHNGGVRGFQSAFRYIPELDLYLYILSNRDNGAEALFMDFLMTLIGKNGDGQ